MISREKELGPIEQNHVPARVSWRRDGDEIAGQSLCIVALDFALDAGDARADFPAVNDALAAEVALEFRMIGDVVDVREEHHPNSAHPFDLFYQPRCETGRV